MPSLSDLLCRARYPICRSLFCIKRSRSDELGRWARNELRVAMQNLKAQSNLDWSWDVSWLDPKVSQYFKRGFFDLNLWLWRNEIKEDRASDTWMQHRVQMQLLMRSGIFRKRDECKSYEKYLKLKTRSI